MLMTSRNIFASFRTNYHRFVVLFIEISQNHSNRILKWDVTPIERRKEKKKKTVIERATLTAILFQLNVERYRSDCSFSQLKNFPTIILLTNVKT